MVQGLGVGLCTGVEERLKLKRFPIMAWARQNRQDMGSYIQEIMVAPV